MNEEFSRLYHLAWNYAESDPEYQENPTYERRCVVQSRIFAELIVGECLTIVERKEYSYHEADPLWETAQLIREHFGVER